jgi:hypothetical protein
VLAAILGTYGASVYWRAGLTLSHYDAKAHLVVARRIFDSLTPRWEQIGAVWLPLPHLLNALPVQIDWMYRTGASAIAISIASFAITAACLSAIVIRTTGSRTGAIFAAALFASNPNVLYLQGTPMTEPLLFAASSLVVLHLTEWALSESMRIPGAVGWTIVAACLVRYEAWPIVGVAMALSAIVKWRRGADFFAVAREIARLAIYPAATVILFMGMSYAATGVWFVTGGFYVPDPELQGHAPAVLGKIRDGLMTLGGRPLVRLTPPAAVVLIGFAAWRRSSSGLLMPIALVASILLPIYAFYSGHPFRIRYEIPLILGCAAILGTAIGLMGRFAAIAAVPIYLNVVFLVAPFDNTAPMVVEAQLDRANGNGRRAITECLQRSYDGTTIMASMGSLAHYMQELSTAGFDLADFMHEGSGPIWQQSYYYEPSAFAGWVMVEEAAEGGDMLFQKSQSWPGFLREYDRVCEGGNVALYRRKGSDPSPKK